MNYLIKVWKDPWIDIDAPFVIEYYGSTLWSNFSAKFNSVSDYNVNMGSKINMNCKNLDIDFGYKIREEISYGGLLTAVADEIHTIQTMKRILFQTDEIVG